MKLIYGRAGVGKTEYIFNDIKNKIQSSNFQNRIYIVTPEQFSFTAEKRLLDTIEEGATTQVEVLSFDRMAYRVIKETIAGDINKIEKSGKAMIIFDAINRNKDSLNFLGKSLENVNMIITQITEFKKHNITIDDLEKRVNETDDRYLKAKLNDMLIMYKELENKIGDEFIDENDLLTILANNLSKSHLFDNCIFYIDEFAGFTKQEYSVIKELNDIASEIYITVCTDDLRITKSPEADIFYDNKNTVQSLCEICDIDKDNQIHLVKNYRFKNDELKALEKNIFDIPYVPYKEELKNIKLHLAENQYAEVEYIATNIIKLVRDEKYRFKDIAVICNNIETYSSLCKVIFEEYEIPVFIDEQKDITQNILIKYFLAVLDIFAKNWSYDSVFNYIKSGVNEIDNIYELENYCLKWGIQRNKFYAKKWDYEKIEENNKEENFEEINYHKEQEQVITPLRDLEQNLKEEKTAKGISSVLYKFLIDNLRDNDKEDEFVLRDEINTNENIDAFNLITDIISEIANIFKDRKITFDEYSKILKMGLSTKELGQIPEGQDKVTVGDVNRSKTHKVKAVFIIGVNDGVFPRVNGAEGFFNDKDRDGLKEKGFELAKGTREKSYEENFNIYKAFSTAEEKLFVSYSASNSDGESLRKSLIISKLHRILPKIKESTENEEQILTKRITFSKLLNNLDDEQWLEVYKWYEKNDNEKLQSAMEGLKFTNIPNKINRENIEKLYGNKLKTSISKLESYMGCPFSYYLKYGLRISEKEKLDIKPIDNGTFLHDVIDKFFEYIKSCEDGNSAESISINNITDDQIKKIVDKIVEEKLTYNTKFTLTAKYRTLVQRLKRVLYISIKYIIESLRESEFEVLGTEVKFDEKEAYYNPIEMTLDDGKKVSIVGKIDRIDIAKMPDGKYIRIIDYKSSTHDIDLNQVIAGLQLQLITYVDAVSKNENMIPAGALYFTLLEPKIAESNHANLSNEEIENLIKQNFRMDGLVLANINIVRAMDKTLETGKSNVIPVTLKKAGDISYSKSNVVTQEEFEKLQKYAIRLIKQISKEILSGNIELKPYYNEKGKNTPCSNCSYKSICQFNPKFKNNNYRFIPNRKKEDALKIIDKD